jgi:hypothetical protein
MLFDSGGGVNGRRNDDMMRGWVFFIFCINHVTDLWSSMERTVDAVHSTGWNAACMNESSRRRMREAMWTSHARDQTLGSECSSSNGPCPIDEENGRATPPVYDIRCIYPLRCVSFIDSTRGGSGGKKVEKWADLSPS